MLIISAAFNIAGKITEKIADWFSPPLSAFPLYRKTLWDEAKLYAIKVFSLNALLTFILLIPTAAGIALITALTTPLLFLALTFLVPVEGGKRVMAYFEIYNNSSIDAGQQAISRPIFQSCESLEPGKNSDHYQAPSGQFFANVSRQTSCMQDSYHDTIKLYDKNW